MDDSQYTYEEWNLSVEKQQAELDAYRLRRENADLKREIEQLKARIILTKAELDGAKALYGALLDCQQGEINALKLKSVAV